LLIRLLPRAFREEWDRELGRTFREVCQGAHRRAGLRGLMREGLLECLDLIGAVVRARFARPVQISLAPAFPRRPKGLHPMQTLAHDLRLAVRSLRASSAPSSIAILTLALGIGVNTVAFSVLDPVLLRPMPFADADRYVELWNQRQEGDSTYPGFSRELLLEWRRQTDLFDRVEAYDFGSSIWKGVRGTQQVSSTYVSPGLLGMLGVPPLEGRVFAAGDGRDGSDALVVISEPFWREQLGYRQGVIGSSLSINGRPHIVIGVMPRSFRFPYAEQAMWLPLELTQPPVAVGRFSMTAFARLRHGVNLQAVEEQVRIRGAALAAAAGSTAEGLTARVDYRARFFDPRTRRSLVVLWGAVAFLLLIVCANVASLSLLGVLRRSRDFAVRAALGARRRDLIRESLVESALIGLAGASLGLLVGVITLDVVVAYLPLAMTFTSLNDIDLDGRVLAFTALAGVGTAIVFGLPPALIGSRAARTDVMQSESRSVTGSTASRRLRSALVITEVTLALVLLVGATLMGRSFAKLQAVDRGFDTIGLLAVYVGFPGAGYQDPRARDRFTEQFIDRLRLVPGVQAVTAGAVPPDASKIRSGSVEFAHAPEARTGRLILPVYEVWPDYFDRVGLPLREGRPFEPNEPAESVIVSESFARRFWPDGSALGGRVRFTAGDAWRTVVGVAGEVRQWKLDDATGSFEWYQPMQVPAGARTTAPNAIARAEPIVEYRPFAIRADEPTVVLRRIEQTLHALDDDVVLWRADPVDHLFHDAVAEPRFVFLMLIVFAALGLVLAAGGIYGVLSCVVTQRLREIGIRLALGAEPKEIFRLIVRGGFVLTLLGVSVGVVLAAGLTHVMRAILYEVEPTDPVSMALVVAIVMASALFASWRPARRAMRVDPVRLLREE
jgi:predicted permease